MKKTRRTITKPVKSKVWRTFLKIDSALKGDLPPECDSAYLVSKGIEPEAPVVLGLIRDHVVPLVDGIRKTCRDSIVARKPVPMLKHFWFLVHNRESGVPTTEDDKACYLDITLVFGNETMFESAAPFVLTTPGKLENINRPSGWDFNSLLDLTGTTPTMLLLHRQAQLVIDFIRAHRSDVSTFTLVKHYRQFFHYAANIGQMRIS